MGSWHTTVLPCHCDNPFYCGLLFLEIIKKKKIAMFLIKRVVTGRRLGFGFWHL
jgi:hypothetical protein